MSIRRRLGRLTNFVHLYRKARDSGAATAEEVLQQEDARTLYAEGILAEVIGAVDDLYRGGIPLPGGCKLYAHHIGTADDEYMRRYVLLHPFGTIRLHGIQKPDQDPDLHDHPWDALCIVLRGGYTEERPMPGTRPDQLTFQRQHFEPGAINLLRATDPHRIVELDGPTWTLVFTGKVIREWGFFTPCGWMDWRTYRSVKGDTDAYAARLAEVGVTE